MQLYRCSFCFFTRVRGLLFSFACRSILSLFLLLKKIKIPATKEARVVYIFGNYFVISTIKKWFVT
jgi:tRNA A37 methylthiotransferase MiaB